MKEPLALAQYIELHACHHLGFSLLRVSWHFHVGKMIRGGRTRTTHFKMGTQPWAAS